MEFGWIGWFVYVLFCVLCVLFCVCCCVKRVCTIHCGVGVRLLFFDSCSFGREGWTRRGKEVANGSRFRFIFLLLIVFCVVLREGGRQCVIA